MRGFLSIAKHRDIAGSIVRSDQFRQLLISVFVGALSSVLVVYLRFHLGLPGHKSLLWMTPILLVRLLGRFKAGASVGAMSAAVVTIVSGGNLAGGFLGLPFIVLAGGFLDMVVHVLEKNRVSWLLFVFLMSSSGLFANLICFFKRLLLPVGLNPHHAIMLSGVWYDFVSYAFFGFLSGLTAALFFWQIERRRNTNSQFHVK